MIVIGLTGSIGMGKSTIAAQCALLGAKVVNADDIVHALMQPAGRAFAAIAKTFPKALKDGKIDRKLLGGIVFSDEEKLKKLESILHPLVIEEEKKFAKNAQLKGTQVVVMDIPLLFETGGEHRMGATLVATAPGFLQAQRVLRRPNMTREKYASILKKQMPDREKRKRADFIVHTGLGKAASMRQIKVMFKVLGL